MVAGGVSEGHRFLHGMEVAGWPAIITLQVSEQRKKFTV
jgi:hypothetical protein